MFVTIQVVLISMLVLACVMQLLPPKALAFVFKQYEACLLLVVLNTSTCTIAFFKLEINNNKLLLQLAVSKYVPLDNTTYNVSYNPIADEYYLSVGDDYYILTTDSGVW